MSIRTLAGCALLSLVFGANAACAQSYAKTSYKVLVTQPDESGEPVSIDTDVYVPAGAPPRRGFPLVEVFHGGGSDKSNTYDTEHAAFFAEHGFVAILYSQRGNGSSGGQESVAGPAEMHDLFDVTAWALGIGNRTQPGHPAFRINPKRIGLTGYSQGGLNTNLAQVWSRDPAINPYGIAFRVLEPGNTADITFNALVPNGVVKLSFGVGLLETYLIGTHARVAPIVDKWIATAALDQPQAYGGRVCDAAGHDTSTSTMKEDLAARSPGCFTRRMTSPSLWSQAFDDNLFPPDMAISMWRRMSDHVHNRLYLSMGGHAAPAAPPAVERDRLSEQLEFFDHFLRGTPLHLPRIVYWTRDPSIAVPASTYRYPDRAWYRQTSSSWPPRGVVNRIYQLGADGHAVRAGARSGSIALAPLGEDERNDPVALAAMSATPLGTSPIPSSLPATGMPGFVAAFATNGFRTTYELTGAPSVRLGWTPLSPDTQLVLEVFDQASGGTLTLLSRGAAGVRGATPGSARPVTVTGQSISAAIHAGHRILVWVLAGDVGFYKPYPDSAGGILTLGSGSALTLPMRPVVRRP